MNVYEAKSKWYTIRGKTWSSVHTWQSGQKLPFFFWTEHIPQRGVSLTYWLTSDRPQLEHFMHLPHSCWWKSNDIYTSVWNLLKYSLVIYKSHRFIPENCEHVFFCMVITLLIPIRSWWNYDRYFQLVLKRYTLSLVFIKSGRVMTKFAVSVILVCLVMETKE